MKMLLVAAAVLAATCAADAVLRQPRQLARHRVDLGVRPDALLRQSWQLARYVVDVRRHDPLLQQPRQ
jgi:hypothetical protein